MHVRERELREARAAAWAESQEYHVRHEAGEKLTPSDEKAWAAALDNFDRLGLELRSIGASTTGTSTEVPDLRTAVDETLPVERRGIGGHRAGGPDEIAFRGYVRGNLGETELRAQGVGSGSAGGFLVPQGFRQRITTVLKQTSSVRRVAELIETDDGAALPWPTNDDTANVGAILAENTQATELDLVMGQKQLGAYTYHSRIVRVSFQLLQDAAFDVDTWLARQLGMRIARIQNAHYTTGTGTAQPQGLVTGATTGKTGAAGQVTTVTYDDLVDLQHSVDPAYRELDCAWMMSDSTFAFVRKLKDSQQHPLVEPDVKAGAPNTLLGYPVVVNNDMPAMAASARSILFGSFKTGYVVRDATDVQVLRMNERYGDFLQAGFLVWMRSDALVQDAAAYKAYAHPAA